MEPELLYRQIGRLIETMPDLFTSPPPPEVNRWLGKACALVEAARRPLDVAEMTTNVRVLNSSGFPYDDGDRVEAARNIVAVLYRVLGYLELKVPPGVGGAFIPVGASFDAYSALSKILGGATKDVFIVDPYLDETVLVEFGRAASEGVLLRLLADEAHVKSSLAPAARKWVEQYAATRPISVRLSPARTLHDRAIFIDSVTAWTLTQSLKDFAKRAPAELVRVDDIASLKIASYQMLWERAQVLVQ